VPASSRGAEGPVDIRLHATAGSGFLTDLVARGHGSWRGKAGQWLDRRRAACTLRIELRGPPPSTGRLVNSQQEAVRHAGWMHDGAKNVVIAARGSRPTSGRLAFRLPAGEKRRAPGG